MLKFLAVGSVDYVMLAIIGVMLVLIVVMFLKNRSSSGDGNLEYAKRLETEGNFLKAKQKLLAALKTPKFKKYGLSDVYDALSSVEFKMKNFDDAEKYAEEALMRNSVDTAALVMLGRVQSEKGDSQKAIEYFEKAVQIKEEADTYILIAMEYAKLADPKSANIAVNGAQKLKYPKIREIRKEIKRIVLQKGKGAADVSDEDEDI
ncbi:MAG: tetratricopeptide repeat protein [Faecalibacterium sp.]|nr:tetratricopeptide repeat protein [Faecalibacterium sp.]